MSPKHFTYLAALMVALLARSAFAADFYVSPTGTASWTQCTNSNTPCNGRTAAENAKAGDVVYFRGGIYDPAANPVSDWSSRPDLLKYESLPWNPVNSGAPNNPIIFKAYPGETPIILDNIYSGAFGVANRSWIVWDGFTGTIVDSYGMVLQLVTLERASNVVIKNCNLIGVRKATHHNSGLIFLNASHDITIENNQIHGMNSYDPGDPQYIETANNAAGVFNFYSYNMTVKNNDIYDNYYGIWDKDTEQNNQYFNNHIWGVNSPGARCSVGIQINDQLNEFGPTSGTKAYNNLIRNCDIGVMVYDGVGTNNGVEISNNTIVDTDSSNDSGIFVTQSSIGARIFNNIVYGYSVGVRYYTPISTRIALSNNNLFYNPASMRWNTGFSTTSSSSLSAWTTLTGFDANSLTSNPNFVNLGGTAPADYRLGVSSNARSAGVGGLHIGAYSDDTPRMIGYNMRRPTTPVLTASKGR